MAVATRRPKYIQREGCGRKGGGGEREGEKDGGKRGGEGGGNKTENDRDRVGR